MLTIEEAFPICQHCGVHHELGDTRYCIETLVDQLYYTGLERDRWMAQCLRAETRMEHLESENIALKNKLDSL